MRFQGETNLLGIYVYTFIYIHSINKKLNMYIYIYIYVYINRGIDWKQHRHIASHKMHILSYFHFSSNTRHNLSTFSVFFDIERLAGACVIFVASHQTRYCTHMVKVSWQNSGCDLLQLDGKMFRTSPQIGDESPSVKDMHHRERQ